jgi:hypothetical protein
LDTEIPSRPSNRSSGVLGLIVGVDGTFVGIFVGSTDVEMEAGESVDCTGADEGFSVEKKLHAIKANAAESEIITLGCFLLIMVDTPFIF